MPENHVWNASCACARSPVNDLKKLNHRGADEASVSVPVSASERDVPSLEVPWYGAALMVLAVLGLGMATRDTPKPSPFEPSWESLHPESDAPHVLTHLAASPALREGIRDADLRRTRRFLLPTELHRFDRACDVSHWRWTLPRYDRARAETFVRASVEPTALQDELLAGLQCAPRGCTLDPSVSVLERLTAASRARVYAELERYPSNPQVVSSHRRRILDGGFARAEGMPAAAVPWVERVQFTLDGVQRLVDAEVVCAHLTTIDDRAAFFRALHGRVTIDAELRAEVDLERVRTTVDRAAEATIVRSRTNLQTVVALSDLLPTAVRARLDRFPSEAERDVNCFSTALSFGGDEVRGVNTSAEMIRRVQDGYRRVDDGSLRLGDVMVFEDRRGEAVHAVNYLMGSLVFTKDGFSRFEPWRVVELADVQAEYPDIAHASVWRPN